DLDSDGITKVQFHWYITHPIMRFLLQEKPSHHPRAKFIKELYKIPRIHSKIVDTNTLAEFLGVKSSLVSQIYEYYHSNNENVSKWDHLEQWLKDRP
ncbi:MAG: hypothetical protein CL916_13570, partial [Deltaproteobacteria bacterium]|nr:hypothetical protein [Deltaproteobacteria bacterium]